MERSIALSRLSKIFGKEFGYKTDPKALTREEREAELEQYRGAVAKRDVARAELQRVRTEHMAKLEATDEYKALEVKVDEARKAAEHLAGRHYARKFTVGTVNSLFFRVEASGDSWEEVFAELKRKGKLK
jgi:hypothetical protein